MQIEALGQTHTHQTGISMKWLGGTRPFVMHVCVSESVYMWTMRLSNSVWKLITGFFWRQVAL